MLNHSIHEQLILHEGIRLKPYKCPAGKWTIGVGRNLEDTGLTDEEQQEILGTCGLTKEQVIDLLKIHGITERQAERLLSNDVKRIYTILVQKHGSWFNAMNAVRQKVIIDMVFNLGMAGFLKFEKMIKHLELRNYREASEEMMNSKWYSQVGERGVRLVKMMATGQDYLLQGRLF